MHAQENVQLLGMGGATAAANGFGMVNNCNPASYSKIGISTLQFGLYGMRSRVTTKDTISTAGKMNIQHLFLGLPAGKNGGISAGFLPYTFINYRAQSTEKAFDSTMAFNRYFGDGGIQKFYIGYGHQYKGFSIGANLNTYFGNTGVNSDKVFYDTARIYSTNFNGSYHYNALNFTLGSQYEKTFKKGNLKDKKLILGATFSNNTNIRIVKDEYTSTTSPDGISTDTIESVLGKTFKATLPMSYTAGIGLVSGDLWKIYADFSGSNWSTYRYDNSQDSTNNMWRAALGASYRKSLAETETYVNRIEYRFGVFGGKNNIQLNGHHLNTIGGTVGLGLPLKFKRGNFGIVNIATEFSSRGTANHGLMQENTTRFIIGVSLSEKWFVKAKFY
jgi:hypothetical protein